MVAVCRELLAREETWNRSSGDGGMRSATLRDFALDLLPDIKNIEGRVRDKHVTPYIEGALEKLRAVIEAPQPEAREQEGYPGIAHDLETMRIRCAELESKLAARRPYSDKMAQEVIEGQVKEIDRLTKLVQAERSSGDMRSVAELLDKLIEAVTDASDEQSGGHQQQAAMRSADAFREQILARFTPPEAARKENECGKK
jgi:hypothetical protein